MGEPGTLERGRFHAEVLFRVLTGIADRPGKERGAGPWGDIGGQWREKQNTNEEKKILCQFCR